MPTCSREDCDALSLMDGWRDAATAAIEDIESWRGHEGQRPNTPTTWWQDEPDVFLHQTAGMVAWITNRHPSVDVKPFTDLHEAAHRWYAEHSAANVASQATLVCWMQRAIIAMTVARQAIFDRSKASQSHRPATTQAGQENKATPDQAGKADQPNTPDLYYPASHYKAKYAIPDTRLRKAAKRGAIKTRGECQCKQYLFSDARRLWPQDIEEQPE